MIACPFCNRGRVCPWCKGTYQIDERVLDTFVPPMYARGMKIYWLTAGTGRILVIAQNSADAREIAGVRDAEAECLGVYLGPRPAGVLL